MPPAGGRGQVAGQQKNVYGLKGIPNYSFLVSIEADIGICPSWGTWRQRYPLLGGQGRGQVNQKYLFGHKSHAKLQLSSSNRS